MSTYELQGSELGMQEYQGEDEQFLGGILKSILGGELEGPLNENQEMELASELLEVTNEAEMEQFLGNLFKSAVKGIGNFARSGTGQALGGMLKNVARTALPVAATALGNLVVPGIGGVLGGKLGSMASNLFELPAELEMVDREQHEFEVARRYVRLAAASAQNAARAPRNQPPKAVARKALVQAARRYAPGLYRGARTYVGPSTVYAGNGGQTAQPSAPWVDDQADQGDWVDDTDQAAQVATPTRSRRRARSGRWVRKQNSIVLLGV